MAFSQIKFYLRPSGFAFREDISQYVLREFTQKWQIGISSSDYDSRLSDEGKCSLVVDNLTDKFTKGAIFTQSGVDIAFEVENNWFIYIEINPSDGNPQWVYIGRLHSIFSEPKSRDASDYKTTKLVFIDKMWDLYNTKYPILNRNREPNVLMLPGAMPTVSEALKKSIPGCNSDDVTVVENSNILREFIGAERKTNETPSRDIVRILNSELGLLFPNYRLGDYDKVISYGRRNYYNTDPVTNILTVSDDIQRLKYQEPIVNNLFVKRENYASVSNPVTDDIVLGSGVRLMSQGNKGYTRIKPMEIRSAVFTETEQRSFDGFTTLGIIPNLDVSPAYLISAWGSGIIIVNMWPSKRDVPLPANYNEIELDNPLYSDSGVKLSIDSHLIYLELTGVGYIPSNIDADDYPLLATISNLHFSYLLKQNYEDRQNVEFTNIVEYYCPYIQTGYTNESPEFTKSFVESLWNTEFLSKVTFIPHNILSKHISTLGSFVRASFPGQIEEDSILIGQKYLMSDNNLKMTNIYHPYKKEVYPNNEAGLYIPANAGLQKLYMIYSADSNIGGDDDNLVILNANLTLDSNTVLGFPNAYTSRGVAFNHSNNMLYIIYSLVKSSDVIARRIWIVDPSDINTSSSDDTNSHTIPDSEFNLANESIQSIAIANDLIYLGTSRGRIIVYDTDFNRQNNRDIDIHNIYTTIILPGAIVNEANILLTELDIYYNRLLVLVRTFGIITQDNTNYIAEFDLETGSYLRHRRLDVTYGPNDYVNNIAYANGRLYHMSGARANDDSYDKLYYSLYSDLTSYEEVDLTNPSIFHAYKGITARLNASIISNNPPLLSISSNINRVAPNSDVTLTAVASDPDNDALTYEWSAPVGVFSDTDLAMVTWTSPAIRTVEDVIITCKVTDSNGAETIRQLYVRLIP